VLGITDHHVIESIYFFDPNGIRLELTVPTASAETTARHAREAHAAVESWTREKAARRGAARIGASGRGARRCGRRAGRAAGGGRPAGRRAGRAVPPRRPRCPTGVRWMPERERRLAVIDVKPGAAMESQSGLQMLRPRIYGAYETAARAPGARADASARSSCIRPATSWATT
jgi:hypothetical protein